MIITPNTEVRLLSGVPLTNNYEHQLTFDSVEAQTSFFYSKVAYSFTDFTYQREDASIRIPRGRDSLYSCNYVMYRNSDFSTKWFYGFITKLEYINPEMTKVYFEADVYQTWMFDIEFRSSFVAREHVRRWNADGSPVVNTVDEGLDYGTDYKVVSVENYQPAPGVYYMVAVAKQGMHGTINKKYYASLNGLPQLLVYYVHPFKLDGTTPGTNLGTLSGVADFLGALYTDTTAVNNVVSIYVTDCLPDNPIYSNNTLSFSTHYEMATIGTANTVFVKDMVYGNWSYTAGNKYNGYSPVTESKLLMHPYTVLELADMRGNKATFKNEYIDSTDLNITISASLGLNNKVVYSLKDYLSGLLTDDTIKTKVNFEHSLINSEPNDMPIMTDLLSAYLQGNRNQLQNQKQAIAWNGSFGALGNMMTRNPVGLVDGVGSAFIEINGMLAKQKDINNTPPQLGHLGGNTYFDYGHRLTGVWIIKKEITPEYRKKLTDYFKMYGYKINEVKTPNLKSREHFNFIQTVGANITGDIPGDDLVKIKKMFDDGVTLWHGDYVGDYTKTNGEI